MNTKPKNTDGRPKGRHRRTLIFRKSHLPVIQEITQDDSDVLEVTEQLRGKVRNE